jgi:hypothetical protein
MAPKAGRAAKAAAAASSERRFNDGMLFTTACGKFGGPVFRFRWCAPGPARKIASSACAGQILGVAEAVPARQRNVIKRRDQAT